MKKTSITRKIILFMFLATLIIMCVGIGLGYFLGFRLLSNTIGRGHVAIVQNLAVSVSTLIDKTLENMIVYTTNPVHKDAILESTLKYKGKDPLAVKEYFLDMDDKWIAAKSDSPLVMEYLRGKSAERLKEYALMDETIAEMFLTDKFGGLVSASGKTSDFYQADEKWWQKAYNGGRGDIYIGDIEYDESSGATAVTIAVPVKDEKGEVIGVCKAILDAGVLFAPIGDFKIGKTGHAVLVGKEGLIIYHHGINPLSMKVCSDKEFKRLINDPKGWGILKGPHIHKQKDMFVASAVIKDPLLLKNGIIWRIFVDKESQETFLPLNELFTQMGIILGILLLMLIPIGFIFGNILVKPIKKLHEATERIGRGELDYPIEIRTGDEIEELADAFKSMVSNIKARRMELEALAGSLEEKVRERTLDLERSQEATLHILEDLQTAKDELEKKTKRLDESLKKAEKSREVMVSMLDDNNKTRKELEKSLDELKNTQKMVVQTEKLSSLGKLVSEMAHEVNNPLQTISGRTQLSLMDEIPNKELEENLKIIESQCYRARDIIKRLLEFSRPTKGEVREKDLKDISEETIKLVEHQYSLAGVKILRDYSPDEIKVKVDANQIEEVFFNILKNASEAMERGGSITVSTSKESGKARIAFKDTGSGMPEEVLKKIFDPFYTTKKEGTGLGLSVCYGLIKDHGGELRYESKPGEGTTAIVTFPLGG